MFVAIGALLTVRCSLFVIMTFLDFFSGIGGFRLALETAGHTCLGHCEIDKYADRSYREMFEIQENEWFANDITAVDPAGLPAADIYCGGFPCQSFSIAGRGRGFGDTRGTLVFEILRLAAARKPALLLLENVKRLVTHDKGRTYETILNRFCELGYSVEWQVCNSKDFGVPQNRERVFLVASAGGVCTGEVFPILGADGAAVKQLVGGHQNRRVYDSRSAAVTLTSEGGGMGGKSGLYAVGSNPNQTFIDLCKSPRTSDTARCLMARYDNGITNRNQSSGVLVREDNRPSVCVKNGTKQGYDVAHEGDSIVLAFPDSKERRGRVGKGVAQTLDTGCQQAVLQPTEPGAGCMDGFRIRKLTPLECWRLQGFPDELFYKARKVNSDNQLYRQAGNSITVNVVYEIGKRLKELEPLIMTAK